MACTPFIGLKRFSQINIDKIPDDEFGIYGFWYKKICLYVGKAQSQPIKKRLTDHYLNCHNDDLKDWIKAFPTEIYFQTKCIRDKNTIHATERLYIARFCPRTNKTK